MDTLTVAAPHAPLPASAGPSPAFPGLEGLAPGHVEPVEALLADEREVSGTLAGFFAAEKRLEIRTADGALERVAFSDLWWLKFSHPADLAASIARFRGNGIAVEALPRRSPFMLTFADGRVYGGELFGYGAALGGLGIYLAEEGDLAIRMFVPAGAIESFAVGERLGKLLLERGQISREGLDLALERQRILRTQRLGALLVEKRVVTRAQLEKAIAAQATRPVQPLGDVLMEMGLLTLPQLEMALAAQRENRAKPLGALLVELGILDAGALQQALAQKLGIPCVDLRRYAFDVDWGNLAPYPICRDNRAVPLFRAAGTLAVALEDPLDIDKMNAVAFALGCAVTPVLASTEDIDWALEHHPERRLYAVLDSTADTPAIEIEEEREDVESLTAKLSVELAGKAEDSALAGTTTLVRLVNRIIIDAHQQKASDIHIECGNGHERMRIRFRRDGALFDYLALSSRFRAAIVSRLKIMANLDISEHRRAQDGKIDFKRFGGIALELRIACVPTQRGLESIVLRLLSAARPIALADIGLAPAAFERLRGLAEKPHGLIVVCGPTGSGKTTTLHSILAHLNTPEAKIWTAEDPIEISQPGLNQVQVHPAIGWTFATALRSFLRADPDVIMIGEVRDEETARIVVESSLTGHLVLTTLHTNSAAESVTRLIDIGLDPFNFSDALLGVLSQRLTRRLCTRCSRREAGTDEALHAMALDYCAGGDLDPEKVLQAWRATDGGTPMLATAVGCPACSNTGYAGRIALYELLVATPQLKRVILQRGSAEEVRRQAMSDGMRTLRQDGIEKVLRGLTTVEQIRAVTG